MSILDYLLRRRRPTAAVARERLQIILAHERASRTAPEFLPALQQDIIQAITKYFPIDPEGVRVQFDRRDSCAVLELNIALPESGLTQAPKPKVEPDQAPRSKAGPVQGAKAKAQGQSNRQRA